MTTVVRAKNFNHPQEFELRLASPKDLNDLLYACRECFPEHFRWRSFLPLGQKWWRVVLKSNGTQVWLAEDRNGIYGFCVIVLDSKLWKAESKKRDGSFIVRVFSVFFCLVPDVWRRLSRIAVIRLTARHRVKYNLKDQFFGRTVWIDLFAVRPHTRNKGCGTWLLKAIEQKTLLSGAASIALRVDVANIPARRMYEKAGYLLSSEGSGSCVYRKSNLN